MKILKLEKGLPLRRPADEAGQALVETAMIIVLFFGIFFGLVQLFHLVTFRINAFDAAGAATRAAVVGKNPHYAGNYVLLSERLGKEIVPKIEVSLQNTKTNLKNSQGEKLTITVGRVSYLQRVVFPKFFSLFGFRWLPGSAGCKMINSPEPKYYYKSYPQAKTDE